jgi:hypothetical protein
MLNDHPFPDGSPAFHAIILEDNDHRTAFDLRRRRCAFIRSSISPGIRIIATVRAHSPSTAFAVGSASRPVNARNAVSTACWCGGR